MYHFAPAVVTRLHQQGWNEDRQIDISSYLAALESEGLEVSDAARAFLRSFGGLTFTFPHKRVPNETDTLRIDPVDAASEACMGWFAAYSEQVGASLCPLGFVHSGYMTLLIDPCGRLYAGFDDTFFLVGESPEEAMEQIFGPRSYTKIEIEMTE